VPSDNGSDYQILYNIYLGHIDAISGFSSSY
jgi:hypothetical protein